MKTPLKALKEVSAGPLLHWEQYHWEPSAIMGRSSDESMMTMKNVGAKSYDINRFYDYKSKERHRGRKF
jgi:hypothetical protein